MADPEFPIREGASTPDASTFEKIVCQNERIGTISGEQPGGSGNGQFVFLCMFCRVSDEHGSPFKTMYLL